MFEPTFIVMHGHGWRSLGCTCKSDACQADFLRARGAFLVLFFYRGSCASKQISRKFTEPLRCKTPGPDCLLLIALFLQWHEFCRQELHIVFIYNEAAANLAPRTWAFVPQNGIWYDACICEPSSTAQMTLPHVKWPRRILAQEKKAYMCCHGPRKGIRRIGFKQGTSWWSLWLHQREHSWDCQRGNGSSTRENIQWVCHQKCLN